MTAAPDCTLYERWLEDRDGDAFAELARRHSGVVYDLAVRYSGDAVLAEDLVQEALLDLALAGSRKPIDVGIVAWMARFAMCRARNVRASERARRKRQQTVGERRREDLMPDDRLEREDELQRALERAEPDERVVLAMRYLHGWDYGRIASALSISEGAARVRVHRALGALRARLGVDAEATAAAGGRRNGSTAFAALPPLLGATPLHRMPDGLLEMGVRNAVETAISAGAGASGTAIVPRVGRLTLQALGLTALLGAATAVSLTAAPRSNAIGDRSPRRDVVASAESADAPGARGTRPGADAWRIGGVPRPPEWDDGVLGRLRPGDAPSRRGEAAEPAAPADPAAAPAPPVVPPPIDRPVEVLRPNLREACAATREPVSSEGERAGIPAGRAVSVRLPSEPGAAPPAEPAPGLPPALVDPAPEHDRPSTRLSDRPTVAIEDLPPEQADLVHEAAALVARLVAADGVDAEEMVVDRRLLRAQSKSLRKAYRKARRRLRRAAVNENAEAVAVETARAAQVAVAQQVLKLLLNVVLADGRTAGELTWPDGADVTAALEDVVSTLGTIVPDGAREELGPGDDQVPVPAGVPDGAALPDGAGG